MSKARDLADGTFDTDTLVVDAANNSVGIGTSSPTSRLQLDGAEDRTGGLTLSAGGQNHTYFLSSDFVNVHNIETSSAAAAHTWQTNGTERLRILSGGGITFNGDTATANALDDYEEGTWTPVLAYVLGGTREYTATSANVGRYTKIGNVVYVTATVAWNGNNGGTTSSYVGVKGLPFAMASTTDLRASGVMGGTVGLTMPSGYTSGFALGLDPSNSHVYVLARSTSGYSHLPTIGASGALYGFSLVYLNDS